MLIERDLDHVASGVTHERVALLVVGELQQLLAEVVAERIGHELDDVRSSLIENDLNVLGVALLKLLLEEATAMLILAEAVDFMARHGLQVVVHEAISIVLKTAALNDASLTILDTTTWSIRRIRVVE